tara:strand:- start:736 stop:861 length:126 start_codon:yes stop_codon:yes gene_type:complete
LFINDGAGGVGGAYAVLQHDDNDDGNGDVDIGQGAQDGELL